MLSLRCINALTDDLQEKYLTAEWIQQFRYKISSAPVVMVDANLNNCALEASCRCNSKHTMWFDFSSGLIKRSTLSQ